MGDIEVGKCEVCGKDNVQLLRTYINFPFIECKCHNTHSILIRHCVDCVPKVPDETKLEIGVDQLRAIDRLICTHSDEYVKLLSVSRDNHDTFRWCDSHPEKNHTKTAATACEAMGMAD